MLNILAIVNLEDDNWVPVDLKLKIEDDFGYWNIVVVRYSMLKRITHHSE